MNLKTSNYGVERTRLGIIEILCWFGVGLGILLGLIGAGVVANWMGGGGFVGTIPGLALAFVSLFGVAHTQGAKAAVDTADYTFQMLKVARDQLAISQQSLEQQRAAASYASRDVANPAESRETNAGVAGLNNATGLANPGEGDAVPSFMRSGQSKTPTPKITDYRGNRIERTIHGYSVLDRTFQTIELAKNAVDAEALKAQLASSNGTAR